MQDTYTAMRGLPYLKARKARGVATPQCSYHPSSEGVNTVEYLNLTSIEWRGLEVDREVEQTLETKP